MSDATPQAHVIVRVHNEGRCRTTDVVEVQLGTVQDAEHRADELNAEHGYDPVIVRRHDGESSWDYYDVETVSTAGLRVEEVWEMGPGDAQLPPFEFEIIDGHLVHPDGTPLVITEEHYRAAGWKLRRRLVTDWGDA